MHNVPRIVGSNDFNWNDDDYIKGVVIIAIYILSLVTLFLTIPIYICYTNISQKK